MKCNRLGFPYRWKWEQSDEEWVDVNERLLRLVIRCYLCRTAEIWFLRFGTRGRAILALPSRPSIAGGCSKPRSSVPLGEVVVANWERRQFPRHWDLCRLFPLLYWSRLGQQGSDVWPWMWLSLSVKSGFVVVCLFLFLSKLFFSANPQKQPKKWHLCIFHNVISVGIRSKQINFSAARCLKETATTCGISCRSC